jgi:trans-aconitate methyltransferase
MAPRHFRLTVRWGTPATRYHLADVEGEDLRDAMARAAASLPDEVVESADLAEFRPRADPEGREYLPG